MEAIPRQQGVNNMDDSPSLLRAIRGSTGLSLRRWAEKLQVKGNPYTHAALGYYETSQRAVPDGLLQMYQEVAQETTGLHADGTGDVIDTMTTLGRADVDRRSFIRTAAYSAVAALLPLEITAAPLPRTPGGVHVGAGEVNAVKHLVDAFTALDEKSGGASGRTAVAEFCATDIAAYLKGSFASERLRQQMFATGAEALYLAGWKSHDAGLEDLAQRYYLHAYRIAMEADPNAHAAYVMRILCHQAFHLGQGALCLPLAEEAAHRAAGRVEPHTEALFTITVARAHAAAGDRRKALEAIARAETQIAKAPDEMPHWAALWGSATAQVHNHAGESLRAVGDLAGAEEKARHAAALWDPETHPRIFGITLARVARAQYDQGQQGDAIATWQQVMPHLEGISSNRIEKLRHTAQLQMSEH